MKKPMTNATHGPDKMHTALKTSGVNVALDESSDLLATYYHEMAIDIRAVSEWDTRFQHGTYLLPEPAYQLYCTC